MYVGGPDALAACVSPCRDPATGDERQGNHRPGARYAVCGAAMIRTRSRGPERLWQEVLRRAAITLEGRPVGVWEADEGGRLHLLAATSEDLVAAGDQLAATLRELGELPGGRPPPRRWVASRLEEHRWCIAPVRRELPRPPPPGVRSEERRVGKECGAR